MLSLKDIKKDYVVGDSTVSALKGVSIDFRENEFVSIPTCQAAEKPLF